MIKTTQEVVEKIDMDLFYIKFYIDIYILIDYIENYNWMGPFFRYR